MLSGHAKAVALHPLDQILAGIFHPHGQAHRQLFLVKVDHDIFSAGSEHLPHEREIFCLIRRRPTASAGKGQGLLPERL